MVHLIVMVLLSMGCGLTNEKAIFNNSLIGFHQIDITDQCEFPEKNILPKCFWIRPNPEQGIVIRDSIAFQDFGKKVISENPYKNLVKDCHPSQLPSFDFSKYTILSIATRNGGCSATYERKILRNTNKRKIIYEIAVAYEGKCEMIVGNWNWAIIPKVPDNYTVEFQIK